MTRTSSTVGRIGVLVVVAAAGAAHGQTWTQEAKLTDEVQAEGDFAGSSVAVRGDLAVVGVPRSDAQGQDSGSVLVFRRTGSTWTRSAVLVAADGGAGDAFGRSVDTDGTRIVVGANGDDAGGLTDTGSVYVFRAQAQGWVQEARLGPAGAATGDGLGYSVAIDGDRVIGGALQADAGGADRGAAVVFRRDGTTWAEEATLTAVDGADGDALGISVDLSGDRAVVGAARADREGGNAGAAYVFVRSGTSWSQEAELLPSARAAGDEFGASVGIEGDTAVVGAPRADAGGTDTGAVWVFSRAGGSWAASASLTATGVAAGATYGSAVAIGGARIVAGAPRDDGRRGRVYAFALEGSAWVPDGTMSATDGAPEDLLGFSVDVDGDTALAGAPVEDERGGSAGAAYVFVRSGSCRADFNGDGAVDTDDFFDFLNAFFASDASADFNGDGTVDTDDFFDFLNAFFAGC